MGKVGFTPLQELVFTQFSRENLAKQFYFTGGTALSVFYLKHRQSEDLDFFSEEEFDNESVFYFMDKIVQRVHLPYRFTQWESARIFEFVEGEKLLIKVDFVYLISFYLPPIFSKLKNSICYQR